jgi:type II secretory pathway component GspD/PulD (secretin)
LHKLPYIGEKIFTSRGVIERKTDLVIQITPKIIEDAYTGIEKSKEVADYEKYVIDRQYPERNIQNLNPANEVKPQFEEEGE